MGEYEINLSNVCLIAMDSRTKVIRIKIKSDQIHGHHNETDTECISDAVTTNTQKEETKLEISDHEETNETHIEKSVEIIDESPPTSNILQLIGSCKPHIIQIDNDEKPIINESETKEIDVEENDDSDIDDEVDEEPESEHFEEHK